MDLIKIENRDIGEGEIQTVNARELHGFLEVGKDFSNWIKDRIDQFYFVENQDFVVFAEIGENPRGGRPAKEYHLTLDMAKELSMVERNEKGKQARQYFIECERRSKNPALILDDPKAMRNLLLTYTEKVIALEDAVKMRDQMISEQAPIVDGFNRIAMSDGAMCITNAAKTIQVQPKVLFKFLSEKKWIYRRAGSNTWIAYQDRIQSGYMVHKVSTFSLSDGEERTVTQALITPKGIAYISEYFSSKEAA